MLTIANLPQFEYLSETELRERKMAIRAQIRSNYDMWLRLFLFKTGVKKLKNTRQFYQNYLDYIHLQADKKRLFNTLDQLIEQTSLLHRELELLGDEEMQSQHKHWLLDDEEIQNDLLNSCKAKVNKRLSLKPIKAQTIHTV